jgi:hypothetical protein
VNLTVSVQLEPAAREVGQLFDTPKLLNVDAMPEIASAAVPLLVNVTVRAALVCPTVIEPNAREVVDKVTAGAVATEM